MRAAVAIAVLAAGCGRLRFDASADASTAGGPPSPVADWEFDEGGGTTVRDVTGNGHDGLMVGGMRVTGHRGGAIELVTDYVDIPIAPVFDRPTDASFSMTGWFRRGPTTVSHGFILGVEYAPTDAMYGLEVENDTTINYWDSSIHLAEATVTMNIGEWNHVAVVVDAGAYATMYFNGAMVSGAVPNNDPLVATAVVIGISNYTEYLAGAVDQVRLYDRALTDQEVLDDMTR